MNAAPAVEPEGVPAKLSAALPIAMGLDADVFRAGLEIMGCLTLPQEVFARPGIAVDNPRDALTPSGVIEPGVDLLAKPYAPDALVRYVRELLDRDKPQPP